MSEKNIEPDVSLDCGRGRGGGMANMRDALRRAPPGDIVCVAAMLDGLRGNC